MFIKRYKKTKCIAGCILFNDDSNYLYWENRNVTDDEISVVNFLNEFFQDKNLKILHVGVGNSYLAKKLRFYSKIDGISISNNEIKYANNLKLPNYKAFFLNKLAINSFSRKNFSKYDIIIDVNLKSFSCCQTAFNRLFNVYSNMLNNKGFIITGKKGMNWSRMVIPILGFSIFKFFYKRLKEIDGNKSNILTLAECLSLSKRYNLYLDNNNENLVTFKKNE